MDKKIIHKVEEKGISIIIPCYNEAPILQYTIEGLLNIEYENLEVIFINDGSKDSTFNVLYKQLELQEVGENISVDFYDVKTTYKSIKYPFIFVIDKYNSGKAHSLNVGTAFAKKELVLTMDGDCILEKNALINMNKTFEDEDVIASGGVVHIMQMFKLENKVRGIVLMQALDYIKGFYIYKASLAYNDALGIISGAFGVFRKNILMEIGGFKKGLGEDIDITLRFQEYAMNHDKKIVFNRKSICYTECPERLNELIRQRVRWQKGFIEAILYNSSFLLNNIFKSNVCFYLIIDALLSNSFASIVLIINTILIVAKVIYGFPLYMFVYYFTTIAFNIICSILAIKVAKENTPNLNTKLLYPMILVDMTVFQFLRIFFFLKGSVTYYFDNKHWDKVTRTSNCYKV